VREAEAFIESLEDGVEQPLETICPLNPIGEVLHRLHREDRIRRDTTSARRCRPRTFVFGPLHGKHFVDIGGQQFEDALQARVRRDGFDSQRHSLEHGTRCFRSDETKAEAPPLAGVGIHWSAARS
jgi:hypothetical protein